MSADFTQSFESKALSSRYEESGKLYIRIPGQMRWDYEKPEQKTAICNGKDTWLYMKGDNTVVKGNIGDSGSSGALLSLLAGTADLKGIFEGEVVSRNNEGITIRLRLKKENEQFDHLLVTADWKSGTVTKIDVFDSLGNRMTYSFENIKENVRLKSSIFIFTIPPGAQLRFEQ